MRQSFFQTSLYAVFLSSACDQNSAPSSSNSEINPSTEALIELTQKSPVHAKRYLDSIQNPVQRDALVLETVEQYPRRSKDLCAFLSTSIGRDRCHRLTERPHLWKAQINHFDQIEHTETIQDRDCTLDPHPNTCWTAQAIFDGQNNVALAIDACRHIQDRTWQAECFFTLAESLPSSIDTLEQRLGICTLSAQFQKSCWMHLITTLAKDSTSQTSNSEWYETVSNTLLQSERLTEGFERDLLEHFYAKSVRTLYEHGQHLISDTPDVLIGHWQNQYAVEALRWCDASVQYLTDWVGTAQDWDSRTCAKRDQPRGMDLESDLWTSTSIPLGCRKISFLGNSHRLYCDGQIDLNWQLALLEASARLRPRNPIFVQEALSSDNEVLRHQAKRLHALNWKEAPDQR